MDATLSTEPARLLRHASKYHRLLRHRLAVPRSLANPVMRGLKHICNPSETAERRRAARDIGAPDEAGRALARDGYVTFDRDTFPDLQRALANYADRLEAVISDAEARSLDVSANKTFLITVLRDEAFFEFPEILEFAISRPVLELTTRYFGRAPLLTAVSLWWNPPNTTMQQSQLFHCDGEDARQLKFLFNVSEVTHDSGPFTLIPAGMSEHIRTTRNVVAGNKVEDRIIEAAGGMSDCVTVTGAPGEGACVDACRLLHYGSRGNTKTRVMLMLRYNDHLAPNVDIPDWHMRAGELTGPLDNLQRLALGLKAPHQ